MAEGLGTGLQNRLRGFKSLCHLQLCVAKFIYSRILFSSRRPERVAKGCEPFWGCCLLPTSWGPDFAGSYGGLYDAAVATVYLVFLFTD